LYRQKYIEPETTAKNASPLKIRNVSADWAGGVTIDAVATGVGVAAAAMAIPGIDGAGVAAIANPALLADCWLVAIELPVETAPADGDLSGKFAEQETTLHEIPTANNVARPKALLIIIFPISAVESSDYAESGQIIQKNSAVATAGIGSEC
jgi:hypothetical protein